MRNMYVMNRGSKQKSIAKLFSMKFKDNFIQVKKIIAGTMLLLDTTLPAGTDRIDTENTISIQKRIGQILALTLPMLTSFNPGYLVKFDEKSAW